MYHKTVLSNGVRIISEPLDHLKSVSLGIWVGTGSRDESESQNGISHFIEHMIFKGTRHRSNLQIAKELDAIGGFSNAFTGKENTCVHCRVLGRHLGVASDILADLFLNSTFRSADVEREKAVILQEISMVEDTPDDSIHELFSRFFWTDHPIGMPVLGTGRTVSSIGKEAILQYMQANYGPERILVVAAGNVNHERLVSSFGSLFERLERRPAVTARNAPRCGHGISVHSKDLEQVHVCVGGAAPDLRDDRRFACALLNTILGGNMSSRLFQEIREKRGLAYAVYSFVASYLDTGVLGIYLATEPSRVNSSLQVVQKEIKRIVKGDVSVDELAAAKEHLTGGIYLSSESSDGRMMRTAKNELVFERYVHYEELIHAVEQVTVDDVVEMAGTIFREDQVSLTALGPLDRRGVDGSTLQFN